MTEPIPDFDLYKTLGVPRGAPPNAVGAAYRGLIRRAHPDVSSEPGSSERSKRLNIARDWLTDPVLRARYDAARPGPADVRARAGPPKPEQCQDAAVRAAAWRAELEVFAASCRALSRSELSRLSAMARDGGPAIELVTRAQRLADRLGRAAWIVHASGAARAGLATERSRGDPQLAELLRQTALGIAVAGVAPLYAEVLLAAWRRAIWEPEARARQRRELLGRANRMIWRALVAAAVGIAALLALLGVVALLVVFGLGG